MFESLASLCPDTAGKKALPFAGDRRAGKTGLLSPLTDYFEIYDEPPPIQKKFRLFSAAVQTGDVLLVSEGVFTGANDGAAVASAEAGITQLLKKGIKMENYRIVPAPANTFRVQLMQSMNTVLATSGITYPTEAAAKAGIRRTWLLLNRFYGGRDVYNRAPLLAPVTEADPALVIPGTTDPYSFQVSVVFPSGYANDFSGGHCRRSCPRNTETRSSAASPKSRYGRLVRHISCPGSIGLTGNCRQPQAGLPVSRA